MTVHTPRVARQRVFPWIAAGVALGAALVVVVPPAALVAALALGLFGFMGRHRDPQRKRPALAMAGGVFVPIVYSGLTLVLFQR